MNEEPGQYLVISQNEALLLERILGEVERSISSVQRLGPGNYKRKHEAEFDLSIPDICRVPQLIWKLRALRARQEVLKPKRRRR